MDKGGKGEREYPAPRRATEDESPLKGAWSVSRDQF